MKITLIAAVAALMMTAAHARAGEGNGNPFPFQAAGVTTVTSAVLDAVTADRDAQARRSTEHTAPAGLAIALTARMGRG